MTQIELYGIPNCDTVKQARSWLDEHGHTYHFHDYKKEGVDPLQLAGWAREVGWEALLNKRGTTFRKLDEADKTDLDEAKALGLMQAHPSLIKRPVAQTAQGLLVGFTLSEWEDHLR